MGAYWHYKWILVPKYVLRLLTLRIPRGAIQKTWSVCSRSGPWHQELKFSLQGFRIYLLHNLYCLGFRGLGFRAWRLGFNFLEPLFAQRSIPKRSEERGVWGFSDVYVAFLGSPVTP